MPVYTYNQETIEIMTAREDLKEQVQMIYELIDGKALNVKIPDLDNKRAVKRFFKYAPDMAVNSLKRTVAKLCDGYLEDLKAR